MIFWRIAQFLTLPVLAALLADAPLTDPKTLSSPAPLQPDPLVDQGGQITVYVGTALFVLGIAAIVGVFSRRVEHAVFTALSLSVILIIFFILSKH